MDQEQQLHDASTSSSRMRIKMKKKSIKQLDKKINNNSKRRFSDEQIRSLETIFESQSKLEPRKKVQLARDLELHPRQVAIWFQNKRARYKSKQLETDFNILRARYNSLASSFEVLKNEKQALANQKLQSELQMEKREAGQSCKHLNSCGLSLDDDEEEEEEEEEEYIIGLDEDEPTSLINMVESGDGGSVSCSGEKWGGLGTDSFFDESGSSYQWWDCLP